MFVGGFKPSDEDVKARMTDLCPVVIYRNQIKGRGTSVRDLSRACNARRYKPQVFKDMIAELPGQHPRSIRILDSPNRKGAPLLGLTEYGMGFWGSVVDAIDAERSARRGKRRTTARKAKSADDAFLDDLFRDTKF